MAIFIVEHRKISKTTTRLNPYFHLTWEAHDLLNPLPMQKVDKMYAAFIGQPLEKVQQYTERDRFLSSAEVK